MTGKLYIVPTPVGNLGDMTPRAVDVLRQASLILAEDTRTSSVLMHHFGIDTPMRSHHKFNEHDTIDKLMPLLEAGQTIALVSDAGTPGISDPGFLLSRECRRRGDYQFLHYRACRATDLSSRASCHRRKDAPHAWPSCSRSN